MRTGLLLSPLQASHIRPVVIKLIANKSLNTLLYLVICWKRLYDEDHTGESLIRLPSSSLNPLAALHVSHQILSRCSAINEQSH